MDRVVDRHAHAFQDHVVAGDAEQAETDDEQAGDRAAAECDVQRRVDALLRRFGGADVGTDGYEHADVAGEGREHCADRETDRGRPVEREAEHEEQYDANHADRRVLAVHVGGRAFLDRLGNFLHARVARRLFQDPPGGYEAVKHCQRAGAHRQPQCEFVTHQIVSQS